MKVHAMTEKSVYHIIKFILHRVRETFLSCVNNCMYSQRSGCTVNGLRLSTLELNMDF